MDTTLVVNPGSASRKYELYQGERRALLVSVEHIGDGFGKCTQINTTQQQCETIDAHAYNASLDEVVKTAIERKVISGGKDITRVGVRVVAPGTYFAEHRPITHGYIEKLKQSREAAPLHIPHVLDEIEALARALPHAHVVGVSDSAFHTTIPDYARTYSILDEDTKALGLYRFGYHGLSVASVVRAATRMNGSFPARAVVCHVGSGVSVTTLRDGKSVDSTMGFSPVSGLMMNTRAGDIDPGALLYLMERKGMNPNAALSYLNSSGGFEGLLGYSDLRIAFEHMKRGDKAATTAVRMYVHRIRKALGAAIATLGGIDLLILTATAVERNATLRELICTDLEGLGILFDTEANEHHAGDAGWLHPRGSCTQILVVHTEEMREMTRITHETVA